jgi:hypothetical protein
MTPAQYLQVQLQALLAAQNPNADPASVAQLSTDLADLWANLILPNLSVNLTTGAVTFIVPGGS